MKILFVGRSVYHFTYIESILKQLCDDGHAVKIIFDRKWSKDQPDKALQRFLEENKVFCGWSLRRKDRWRKYVFGSRELLTFTNYLSRKNQSEFYLKRWQNYLSPNFRERSKSKYMRWIFRRRFFGRILKTIEYLTPPAENILEFLRRKKPDVVVASPVNMRFSEEIEYIKAAKRLGIPTVVCVLSWDNLSTKGLIHVCPTAVLAWNQAHFDEAVKIHGIPENHVLITGSPFFDKWFIQDNLKTKRDDFCRKVGLNSKHPFITYLGSSKNIARNEVHLLEDIISSLRKSSNLLLKNMGILVRPHPANAEIYKNINEEGVVVWPKEGYLPDSPDSIDDFSCSLKYALATIGINTSGMIDSVIVNTPCIAIMTDEYNRTQSLTSHFNHMLQSGCLYNVHNVDMLNDVLVKLDAGNDYKSVQRADFVKTYVRPYGKNTSAGFIAAQIIDNIGKGQPLQKVHDYLERMKAYNLDDKKNSFSERAIQFADYIESAKNESGYKNYVCIRDQVLKWLEESSSNNGSISGYWQEEVEGFDYMLDASPLIIRKLREHTYHITGLKTYEYREHHSHAKNGFEWKLKELSRIDGGKYFIPESVIMGGFGHNINGYLVNIDTLKFYEALLALKISGILSDILSARKRKVVLEIGGGWGGFAYQFKTIAPDTCYIIIDLPQTMLFSATYLMTLFPNSKYLFYGEDKFSAKIKNANNYDFIFLPHYSWSSIDDIKLDLSINMISFQEMTSEQVRAYAEKAYLMGCNKFYSFNRERSKHNTELTTVSSIIEQYYEIKKIEVLDVPYTTLNKPKIRTKTLIGDNIFEYRHLIGTRK